MAGRARMQDARQGLVAARGVHMQRLASMRPAANEAHVIRAGAPVTMD